MTVSAVGNATMFVALGEADSQIWKHDSITGGIVTPFIDGQIEKICYDFQQAPGGHTTAVIGLRTRDTPHEWISVVTNWTADITHTPLKIGTNLTNAAFLSTVGANVLQKYIVHGSCLITCSGAYSSDSVKVKLYYR